MISTENFFISSERLQIDPSSRFTVKEMASGAYFGRKKIDLYGYRRSYYFYRLVLGQMSDFRYFLS